MRVAEERWVLGRLVATYEVRVCVLDSEFERVAIQQLQNCGHRRCCSQLARRAVHRKLAQLAGSCTGRRIENSFQSRTSSRARCLAPRVPAMALNFQDLLIEDLLPQDKSLHKSCRERVSAWASEKLVV